MTSIFSNWKHDKNVKALPLEKQLDQVITMIDPDHKLSESEFIEKIKPYTDKLDQRQTKSTALVSLQNLNKMGIIDAVNDLIFTWLLPNTSDKLKQVARGYNLKKLRTQRMIPPLIDSETSINTISTLPASPNDSDWHNEVGDKHNIAVLDNDVFWLNYDILENEDIIETPEVKDGKKRVFEEAKSIYPTGETGNRLVDGLTTEASAQYREILRNNPELRKITHDLADNYIANNYFINQFDNLEEAIETRDNPEIKHVQPIDSNNEDSLKQFSDETERAKMKEETRERLMEGVERFYDYEALELPQDVKRELLNDARNRYIVKHDLDKQLMRDIAKHTASSIASLTLGSFVSNPIFYYASRMLLNYVINQVSGDNDEKTLKEKIFDAFNGSGVLSYLIFNKAPQLISKVLPLEQYTWLMNHIPKVNEYLSKFMKYTGIDYLAGLLNKINPFKSKEYDARGLVNEEFYKQPQLRDKITAALLEWDLSKPIRNWLKQLITSKSEKESEEPEIKIKPVKPVKPVKQPKDYHIGTDLLEHWDEIFPPKEYHIGTDLLEHWDEIFPPDEYPTGKHQ